MTKAVIYARVSSKEQEKECYSIPAQAELLKEYASKNNITIVQEYTDSETAKQAGRTNFNEMRQEDLIKQFDEAVQKITIDKGHRNWLVEALKLSFEDQIQYIGERVASLTKQKEKIKDRLNKLYLDKLDGNITQEFWLEKHTQWNRELESIQGNLIGHEKSSVKYLEEGIKILELCTNAYSLYSLREPEEKVKMLKILLSNCTLKGGKVSYTYKEPFDILAKGLSFNKTYAWRLCHCS